LRKVGIGFVYNYLYEAYSDNARFTCNQVIDYKGWSKVRKTIHMVP